MTDSSLSPCGANNLLRHWDPPPGGDAPRAAGPAVAGGGAGAMTPTPGIEPAGVGVPPLSGRLYLIGRSPPRGGAAHPGWKGGYSPCRTGLAVQALENGWRTDTEGDELPQCVFRSPRRHATNRWWRGQSASSQLLPTVREVPWQRGAFILSTVNRWLWWRALCLRRILAPEEGVAGGGPRPPGWIDIAE